jgi:class 3 adenylate cyclase
VNPPETRFAVVDDDRVAWQQIGSGARDVVIASGLWSHLDLLWEEPSTAAAYQRIAAYARLIRYDRRGSGLSDQRPSEGSMIEHWIADLAAVLDAADARAPILLAIGDTGPLVLKFYARFPERCGGLILINTSAGLAAAPDYPEGHAPEVRMAIGERIRASWGREEADPVMTPGPSSAAQLRFFARLQRAMASPKAVLANLEATGSIDSRDVLLRVTVPTLIVTHRELTIFTAAQARYMASQIACARIEELPGNPRIAWDDAERMLVLIEEFVTGQVRETAPRRVLATLLMTDIVDSTRQLARLGDAAWRAKLDRHDHAVREQIERHGGRLVDTAGDGTLVQFDTPGAAIECAAALHLAMDEIDLGIRAGIHIGEVELREEGRIGGMAVHIAARVLGRSDGGETWVSRTVRDVLIGGHYRFKERGIHELKGVPSKWPLYAVVR